MGHAFGKIWFLLGLTALGGILVLVIYQVPQPWRGVLVAWLLFIATAGVFILRLVGHYLQFKTQQLAHTRQTNNARVPAASPRRNATASGNLRVIRSTSAGSGRRTI